MIIRLDKSKTISTSQNNVIGPSTSLLRTDYTVNDSTSIYVAPNGSDGNPGTQASPKLTIDGAIAALGTKQFITLISNGFVGDLVFDAPLTTTNNVLTIQSRRSTVAYIQHQGNQMISSTTTTANWNDISVSPSGVWVATTDDATNNIYYSNDGYNWSLSTTRPSGAVSTVHCNKNGRFVCAVTTGTLYYSDDGDTWTTTGLATTSPSWRDITSDDTGAFIATSAGSVTKGIFYSSDGTTFSNVDTRLAGACDYGNGKFVVVAYGTTLSDQFLLYSQDGQTWAASQKQIYNSNGRVWINPFSGRWFFCQSNGPKLLQYSDDEGNTWINSGLDANPRDLTFVDENTLYACYLADTSQDSKITKSTDDGVTIDSEITTPNDEQYISITNYNGFIRMVSYQDTTSGNPSYIYHLNDVLFRATNTLRLNNLYLDGLDTARIGVYGGDNSITIEWCDFDGISYAHVVNSDTTFTNTVCRNSEYATLNSSTTTANNSIFDNISKTVIDNYGNSISVNHCVFYDCFRGVRLNDSVSSVTLKNSIFYRCVYDVQSLETQVTLSYSITNGILEKTSTGTDVVQNVKPLFHDVLEGDFKIRHESEGYPIESFGILAGDDSKDFGAWDFTFTVSSIDWIRYHFEGDKIEANREFVDIISNSDYTYTGTFYRSQIDQVEQYTINSKKSSYTNDMYKFKHIEEQNTTLQVFPVDEGKFTPANQGGLIYDTNSISERWKFNVNSSDLSNLETWFGNERPEGWYITILSIAGSTGAYTVYPFKIVGYSQGQLILENYHNKTPGSGFSSVVDGNYAYYISKGLLACILKYTGQVGDLYEFEAQGLDQKFIKNQWVDYWFYDNYFNDLGSRSYFRIISNTDDKIYTDNPLNISLVLNNTNVAIIDLAMMKCIPSSIRGQYRQEGQFGKHGNDFYNTTITQDQNIDQSGFTTCIYHIIRG